ncbi:hypothetical protein BJY04DRAFT_94374 [Aspergillus karnatakaensis]|uniref:uncharacterized protein n=1 Tax=Aspergillus karnatakaensis TaxID=1810916 RepID=UPI003CCD42B1
MLHPLYFIATQYIQPRVTTSTIYQIRTSPPHPHNHSHQRVIHIHSPLHEFQERAHPLASTSPVYLPHPTQCTRSSARRAEADPQLPQRLKLNPAHSGSDLLQPNRTQQEIVMMGISG